MLFVCRSFDRSFTSIHELLVGVVTVSALGGCFVLHKVSWTLVIVRCREFRGVRFSEVKDVLVVL